jgi:hypothetical protein
MYHNDDHELPLVAGVTETAQSEPGLRLSSLLSGMLPQPTRDRLAESISELEAIVRSESDEETKTRIGAAISMLRGHPSREID